MLLLRFVPEIVLLYMQVRNSGFNKAYAVNFPVPRSLFRYLTAADHLREVTLQNPQVARAQVPVLKLALDFLESEQKRAGVCSHAVDYLSKLLGDVNRTLDETSLQTSFPSSEESANRYPPKERGSKYSNWSTLLPYPCHICGADTCFAAVQLEKSYVGCLKCLREGYLEDKKKLGILIFPELERLRETLQLVAPSPCETCCREGLGASDEELTALRVEEAPGNLVYKDCLEAPSFAGVLTLSTDGELKVGTRKVTRELVEQAYASGAGAAAERAEAQALLPVQLPPLGSRLFQGRELELEKLLAQKQRGAQDTEAAVDLLSLSHGSSSTTTLPAPPATPAVRPPSPTDFNPSACPPPGAPQPTPSPSSPVLPADSLPSPGPVPVLPTHRAPSFPGLFPF
jgi:hypothetical protein